MKQETEQILSKQTHSNPNCDLFENKVYDSES